MKICIFCSANEQIDPDFFRETEKLGIWAAKNGHSIVYGGVNCGLMECVAKAAHEAGGKTLELTELTTNQIVTKNNAVILKSTASPIVMTLTTTASENDFSSNSLEGVPAAAGMPAADPSTTYVLANKTYGVGFYRLKSGETVPVGKAYLTYSGSGAPSFLGFDETTGVNEVRPL